MSYASMRKDELAYYLIPNMMQIATLNPLFCGRKCPLFSLALFVVTKEKKSNIQNPRPHTSA